MVNEISARKTGKRMLFNMMGLIRNWAIFGGFLALLAVIPLLVPQAQAAHINPTVIATIPVGTNPFGIAVNPIIDRVYVANYGSGTVSVIDGTSYTVVASIPVEFRPAGIAVNPITNRIYVANSFNNTISVIDGANNIVIATIPVGLEPSFIDVNTITDRIYVSNSGNDTVSVIDGTSNTVIFTIPVGIRPFGIGVNPNTDLVYVANFNSHTVSVIDGGTNTVIDTIPVGTLPVSVGVNPTTNRVYFALGYSSTFLVYDGATNTFIPPSVPVGLLPIDISVNQITNRVYVANLASEDVTVIDGANNTVIATIKGNLDPYGVDVNPTTDRAYVANYGFNTVSVIADDLSAPTWPEDSVLTASNIGFTSLTLSWTPAQDNIGVTSYKIYQNGTLIIEYWTNIVGFSGLTAGTQYTFKVEACDATGNCSTDGPSVNVRTLDDLSAPTWPDGSVLTASNIGFTSLTLSWTPAQDNAEVVLYQIYKDGTFLATVPEYFLTYDVEGLTANTQYTFKVEACDAVSNCSTDGPSVNVRTLDDLSAPTWPDGSWLTASNIGFTSLTLSWTPAQDNAGVVLYQIYKDGTFFGLTYDVEGLTANTQYTFKVEACDATGNCSTDGPSVDVRTLTPQEAGQQLITNVNNLVNKGALNEGQGNSLTAKLEAAIQQLDRGNSNASINQLQAFTNEVKAYVKGGVLSSKEGQLLIDAAQKIISVLGS